MKKHKTFFIAASVYLLSVTVLLIASLIMNRGHFVYALDDPYIHMTIAKNFALNGFWAVNSMTFTSASSSPLWTLLISAAYYLFGINVITPFVLNIIFGILCILVGYFILHYFKIVKPVLLILFALIFITPMPAILFTGMEHTAHITVSILFVFLGSRLITKDKKDLKTFIYLLLLAPLLTGFRYEGAFLLFVVCILLALRKKFIYSILILLTGSLPILIYGFISLNHGWLFIPNTILVKSRLPDFSFIAIPTFLVRSFRNNTEPHILVILLAGIITFYFNYKKNKTIWKEKQVMLLLFILVTLIHETFAQNGWFFRYEAYIIALAIITIPINLIDYFPDDFNFKEFKEKYLKSSLEKFGAIIITAPLFMWALTIFIIPLSTNNIYDQHFQMGNFVRNYLPPNMNISANDIGTVSFYSNNYILDLWGLADIEVGRDRIRRRYDINKIDELTRRHNIKLAIVYEHWFDQFGGLPLTWEKIGEWTMTDFNITCGTKTVCFYSTNKSETELLKKKLEEYSAKLPESVIYIADK